MNVQFSTIFAMMSAILKALISLIGAMLLADTLFKDPLEFAAASCFFGFAILFVYSVLESFISGFTIDILECFP